MRKTKKGDATRKGSGDPGDRPEQKVVPPIFLALCRERGLGEPMPEFRFDQERRWRADFAWPHPKIKVLLEIEGGVWSKKSRHFSSGKGILGDFEKYNRAASLGYRIVRCSPQQFASGEIMDTLAEVIMYTPG